MNRSVYWLLACCLLLAGGCQTTGGAAGDDEQLIAAAVSAVVADNRPHEGTIIAFFREDTAPARIWKISGGTLTAATRADYDVALGPKREQWRPVVSISIKEKTASAARVEVSTLYDAGLGPRSRGGNAAEWDMSFRDGAWQVTARRATLHWD